MMTRLPDRPIVDARRTKQLRQALLRDIASMAPAWRGAHEDEGADRAIVEVAARLSEEATKRLDQMPERDALAFLDMFEIAPPMPVAAKGFAVFALKEDRASSSSASERTGIEIESAAGDLPFETMEDLRVQPAHIRLLATVDPNADRIEIAPEAVTTLEPDGSPRVDYRLAAAAGPEAQAITVRPPVGIAEGDLLRLGEDNQSEPVFALVAKFAEDGIVELEEPLGGEGFPAGESVRRMVWLDAFVMPDAQEHALYIGDPDVLNVEEPATLRLHFKPECIADLLRTARVRVEAWGTKNDAEAKAEPSLGWHALALSSVQLGALTFEKYWTGPLEEFEIGDRNARWLRIVPASKIVPDEDGTHALTGPDAAVRQLSLAVNTDQTDRDDGNGDDNTISQISHNGLPLSRASSFQPFGAEPQRFDIFSLAAPEAFSKRGATAMLHFELAGRQLLSISEAERFDGKRHLYGIGENGKLQTIDLEPQVRWREFSGPPVQSGGDAEETLRLDAVFGVRAFGLRDAIRDRIVVRVENGDIYSAEIKHDRSQGFDDDSALELTSWVQLEELPGDAPAAGEGPTIIVAPRRNGDGDYRAFLCAAMGDDLLYSWLEPNGSSSIWLPLKAISQVGHGPDLPAIPRLFLVDGPNSDDAVAAKDNPPIICLAIDNADKLWGLFIQVGADGGIETATWVQLQYPKDSQIEVVPGSTPTGLYHYGTDDPRPRLSCAFLTPKRNTDGDGQLAIWSKPLETGATATLRKTADVELLSLRPSTRFAVVPNLVDDTELEKDKARFPHVVVYDRTDYNARVFEWSPNSDEKSLHAIPTGLLPSHSKLGALDAVVFGPQADQRAGLVALLGAEQAIVQLALNKSYGTNLHDWIDAPAIEPNDAGVQRAKYPLVHLVQYKDGVPELESDPDNCGIIGNDNPVFKLGDGDTDWINEVRAYRSNAEAKISTIPQEQDGEDENEGEVDHNKTIEDIWGELAGESVLVIGLKGEHNNTDEIPKKPDVFGVYTIAKKDDGIEAKREYGSQELRELVESFQKVAWYVVKLAKRVLDSEPQLHRLSLIDSTHLPEDPEFAGLFSPTGTFGPLQKLLETPDGNIRYHLLVAGWPGPVKQKSSVKFLFEGDSPETVISTPLPGSYTNPELSWEYFDGNGWKRLELETDDTRNFARSGDIKFKVPDDLQVTEIGGQEDYWIRARLVGGDYGRIRFVVVQSDKQPILGGRTRTEQEVQVRTDQLRPPEVASVTASFNLPAVLPEFVIARNNLQDLDQSSANRLTSAGYQMFQGAFASPLADRAERNDASSKIYSRSLLVGLSRPLDLGLCSLFVLAHEQEHNAKIEIHTLGADQTWVPAPLTREDPTRGLARTGLIKFSVSHKQRRIHLLGEALYWVRIRATGDGSANWAPQIDGLWLNGVEIVQAETIVQELLGSADGEPDFEVQLSRTPVLPDELELRIRERLSDEEVAGLREAGGSNAVLDDVADLPGQWVRWRRVDGFAGQSADARVYVADAGGTVKFGNGRNGRLIVAGRDNIRAFKYRSGGSRVETSPFPEASVLGSVEALETIIVPTPIAGGRDVPDANELISRMPDVLRHAGQGLSLGDLEALARDIDSEIVQVRAFGAQDAKQPISIAVLARGNSRTPVYSRARRDALQRALAERVSDAWAKSCLEVVSVDFVKVNVKVCLISSPGEEARLEARARSVLDTFLHATEGGPEGQGWPPGRGLWPADIRRALADVPGLDRIDQLTIEMPDARPVRTVCEREVITTADTQAIGIEIKTEAQA